MKGKCLGNMQISVFLVFTLFNGMLEVLMKYIKLAFCIERSDQKII